MKNFFKYVVATITGIIIVNILFLLIFIGFIGFVNILSETTPPVKNNSVLYIDLKYPISDRVSNNPLDNFVFQTMSSQKNIGLKSVINSIKYAAGDERIKGIYLNIGEVDGIFGGLGSIKEIRDALEEFKRTDKFIYSYSNSGYSQKGYYLVSVADSVFINPEATVWLSGISTQISMYKNTLDKIGLKAEVVKVGKFKAAVEPFLMTEISEANRKQIEAYNTSLWNNIASSISESRNIEIDSLNYYVNNFRFHKPEKLIAMKLIDDFIYEDEIEDKIKKSCGLDEKESIRSISIEKYYTETQLNAPLSPNKIAVVYAQGEIGEKETNNTVGPELAKTIGKLKKDDNIKAIVLRVNSPGGSALTSDIIWREISLAKKAKPVIVSMGDVAASGGYYISCAADSILAEPTTITGSIGIFGLFFSGEKLIKETFGIRTDVVKTHKFSDFGGNMPLPLPITDRGLNIAEKTIIQEYIERGYRTFLSKVARGRHLEIPEVDAIGQGRVWTGEDALKIGLVDKMGGLDDAIAVAARMAGIDSYEIAEYPKEKDMMQEILSLFRQEVSTYITHRKTGLPEFASAHIRKLLNREGFQARIEDIHIE